MPSLSSSKTVEHKPPSRRHPTYQQDMLVKQFLLSYIQTNPTPPGTDSSSRLGTSVYLNHPLKKAFLSPSQQDKLRKQFLFSLLYPCRRDMLLVHPIMSCCTSVYLNHPLTIGSPRTSNCKSLPKRDIDMLVNNSFYLFPRSRHCLIILPYMLSC